MLSVGLDDMVYGGLWLVRFLSLGGLLVVLRFFLPSALLPFSFPVHCQTFYGDGHTLALVGLFFFAVVLSSGASGPKTGLKCPVALMNLKRYFNAFGSDNIKRMDLASVPNSEIIGRLCHSYARHISR